ncbi:MAG: efflux RND transporter permease subunit [Phycisphaerales bacterium]
MSDDAGADRPLDAPTLVTRRGAVAWMTRNHVAANLLMLAFIVGGLLVASRVKQEVFPEFTVDRVSVSVPYPGASPAEVEQGILLSIEDQVRGLDGVKEVTSTANEGSGNVSVELLTSADKGKALQDVKNAVDRIRSFPEDAERPVVSMVQVRNRVISLMVTGDTDRRVLRELAEGVRDELINRGDVTLVELGSVPRLEIAIEVPDETLRALDLTLADIARTVRASAVELPAGAIKTPGGEVLMRTQERRDVGAEFADIPIATTPEGTRVLIGDVATVRDGFEDTDNETFFDGKPAVQIDVYRVGQETPTSISNAVLAYVADAAGTMPDGIDLIPWDDDSEEFRDRMKLLLKNAFLGLILVLLLLGLFLEPRLAFWVTLGIPISILGAFLIIPFTGASVNMISLFAFIVTLGIIVDDAVVMGENIYARREQGMPALDAAILGAREIAGPITFAVLTNIAAFMPLMFVPGAAGNLFGQIPAVTIAVFIVSLVESIFVLPAHLSHRGADTAFWRIASVPSQVFGRLLAQFVDWVYEPLLRIALRGRYITAATGVATLILCAMFVRSGGLPFTFIPRIEGDTVTARATLPFGVPVETAREIQARLVAAVDEAIGASGQDDIVRGRVTTIGSFPSGGGPGGPPSTGGGGAHLVGVQVRLVPSSERTMGAVDFSRLWREAVGEVPGVESLSFRAEIGAGGEAIDIQLTHRDADTLDRAAVILGESLREFNGVTDVDDGVAAGKPQLDVRIRPEARSLGVTASDIARQLRGGFFGIEALRQQRGRNEIRVLVRLPESERRTLNTLENMTIRPNGGGEIPLGSAVTFEEGRSYTQIRRKEGRRIKNITADVEDGVTSADTVLQEVRNNVLPDLLAAHPGLGFSLEGEQNDRRESLSSLAIGFPMAMLAIYALLAIPFRSYVQPLLVMAAIPFGAIGAVIGHWLLGYGLSIMSMFGVIALAGVAVNDSLVLVFTANRLRDRADAAGGAGMTEQEGARGLAPFEAVVQAGKRRFRPILLTSLTTFFGLAPMIFETSVQARFLIPMALSLGFGILFATVVILVLLPSLYLILEDGQSALRQTVEAADSWRPRPDAGAGAGGGGGTGTGTGAGMNARSGAAGPAATATRSPQSPDAGAGAGGAG